MNIFHFDFEIFYSQDARSSLYIQILSDIRKLCEDIIGFTVNIFLWLMHLLKSTVSGKKLCIMWNLIHSL